MAKKPRNSKRAAQLARRKLEQKERKRAGDRQRLFALSPGGSGDLPLTISSPSIIESRAASLPCPQCSGTLLVDEHSAAQHKDELLRLIHAHCRECGHPCKIWFRLEMPKAN